MAKRIGRTIGGKRKAQRPPKVGGGKGSVKMVGAISGLAFERQRRSGFTRIPTNKAGGTSVNGPKMFRGGKRVNTNISNLGERYLGGG